MRLHRNKRALSPIFATLILIAIAVIAGIIVYMFTSGTLAAMMGGGTSGQEKVSVQSAVVGKLTPAATDSTVNVLYQSTGGPIPTVTAMLLKNAAGNTVLQFTDGGANDLGGTFIPTGIGVLTSVTGANATALPSGSYTVTLVTKAGGSFVSPSFVVP